LLHKNHKKEGAGHR